MAWIPPTTVQGAVVRPLLAKLSESCLGAVVRAAAARLRLPANDPDVQRCTYMLWSFVHGHSFLHIDMKTKVTTAEIDDWEYLMDISSAILAPAARSHPRSIAASAQRN